MTRKARTRANSTEVARLAGVSIAAVSRAFTPGASISKELADRVFTAARQLNYVPNNLARSLITRQTNIVAMMLPPMSNPIFADMLEQASLSLEKQGKQVLLFTPMEGEDFDGTLLHMLQYQVDAIVIAAASISSRMASLCLGRGVPVITLGRYLPGVPAHSVRSDDHGGSMAVADLVLKGGGRRFGLIDGPSDLTTIFNRRESLSARFREAMGPDAVQAEDGGLTYGGGYRAAMVLMNQPERPDTLIGLTDIMALGAMDAVRHEFGLRVPEDVAVVGFDDIAEASFKSYQLTTVRSPIREMVAFMMDVIMAKPPLAEPSALTVPAQLIVRGSTRPV